MLSIQKYTLRNLTDYQSSFIFDAVLYSEYPQKHLMSIIQHRSMYIPSQYLIINKLHDQDKSEV